MELVDHSVRVLSDYDSLQSCVLAFSVDGIVFVFAKRNHGFKIV